MKEESFRHWRVGKVGVEVINADVHKNSIGKQGEVKQRCRKCRGVCGEAVRVDRIREQEMKTRER